MFAEIELLAHRPDGSVERLPGPVAIDAIEERREVMYRPEAGTWIAAQWTITNTAGQWICEVEFNYDSEPTWSREIDPGLYGLTWRTSPGARTSCLNG